MRDDYNDDELDLIMGDLKNEDTALQKRGVVEFTSDNGLVSKDFFHIKDSVKEEIFEDVCHWCGCYSYQCISLPNLRNHRLQKTKKVKAYPSRI